MCGLAGGIAYQANGMKISKDDLDRMQQIMIARGPDGVGYWQADDQQVGLVHRRLSIIDLSHGADQPMLSADERYALVFNGEIYNYVTLRKDLESAGHAFKTHSDTEVILQLYQVYGAAMLNLLRGMYAIAIWDKLEKKLFLARDPFGIKPLYYADNGKNLFFASQVKSLLTLSNISKEPSPAGHAGFFIFGHIPEPYTLYEAIKAFPAGAYAEITAGKTWEIKTFCNLSEEIQIAEAESLDLNEAEQKEKLYAVMLDSVKAHLVADVPIAFFLSAGIDSSVLLALAKELNYDTQALTLSFSEYQNSGKDELPLAKQVAEQFNVPWHLKTITEQDFLNEFPKIMTAMDQPSIDGANTYFVSKLAAELGFKVAVSGLGADELFGGYAIYRQMPQLLQWGNYLKFLPVQLMKKSFQQLGRVLKKEKHFALPFLIKNEASIYLLLRSLYLPDEMNGFNNVALFVQGLRELNLNESLQQTYQAIKENKGRVQALETKWYMRNQLLRDSDWAGMAHSIEIRVPFVDIELWRQVLRLNLSANKKMLFTLPENKLPAEILTRPKSGFNIPVNVWCQQLAQARKYNGMQGWSQFLYQQFTGKES